MEKKKEADVTNSFLFVTNLLENEEHVLFHHFHNNEKLYFQTDGLSYSKRVIFMT